MAALTALATLAVVLSLLLASVSSASTSLPSRRSSTTSGSKAIAEEAKALAGNGFPRLDSMLRIAALKSLLTASEKLLSISAILARAAAFCSGDPFT